MDKQGKNDSEGQNDQGVKIMPVILDEKQETFKQFFSDNKTTIRKIIDKNSNRNDEGKVVVPKDDPWRAENDWDELYKEMKEK